MDKGLIRLKIDMNRDLYKKIPIVSDHEKSLEHG